MALTVGLRKKAGTGWVFVILGYRERGKAMRGADIGNGSLFSYVDLEDRVPKNHPLRVIRRISGDVLAGMSR